MREESASNGTHDRALRDGTVERRTHRAGTEKKSTDRIEEKASVRALSNGRTIVWRIWTRALAAAALFASAPYAQAEGEALPVVLAGDPGLVAQVGRDLRDRGVILGPAAARAVEVTLTRAAGEIVVTRREPDGATTERVVSTPDTAAAVIESWTRPSIADPLLLPRRPRPPTEPASADRIGVAPPAVPEPQTRTIAIAPVSAAAGPSSGSAESVATAPTAPPRAPAQEIAAPGGPAETVATWTPILRLGGETSTGRDRSLWLGASAGACARLRGFCLGPELRLARQLDLGREESLAPRRPLRLQPGTDWEAMLLGQWPFPLGRALAVLGFGAGVGRRPGGSPADVGLRGEARAELALPLWSRLSLEVGLAAVMTAGERDPGGNRRQMRVGVGLRWGGP
jgi:hypothetical protein